MIYVLGVCILCLTVGFFGGIGWTLRWFGALVLTLVAVIAGAQPIDGWVEYQRPKYDPDASLEADGSLVLRVHGYSAQRGENVHHMIQAGPNTDAATIEFAFSGDMDVACAEPLPHDPPVCGWSQLISSGYDHGGCASGHPPIAADETFGLTVRDLGDRFVWLYVGSPSPMRARWELEPEGRPFTAIGILEALGDGRYVVRTIRVVEAIPMRARVRAAIAVVGQTATGVVEVNGLRYEVAATVTTQAPGQLGLIAVTTPRSLCTDGPWREFTTYSVEAR